MARSINEVRVVGLGKVGELVATLLADTGFTVTAYDARERADLPFVTKPLDVRDAAALQDALAGADAVVSCLPYNLNLAVAEAAHASATPLLRPDRGRADHPPGAAAGRPSRRRPSSLRSAAWPRA